MKILLLRHGQSRWQVERGEDWNSPLTELGLAQAQDAASWLAANPRLDNGSRLEVGTLLASPYLRAQQTAAPIAESLKLPLQTADSLREADFLVSDHLPSADGPGRAYVGYEPSGLYRSLKDRASEALEVLVEGARESGQPVLAITHGGLISTLLRIAAGSDEVSFWIYNASFNLIEWKRGRWHLVFLNLWDHLSPERRTY